MSSTGLSLLPVDCFAPLAGRRGSVWLDSSLTRADAGRHSFMATDPAGEITWARKSGQISDASGRRSLTYDDILRELDVIRNSADRWAIGFIGYEAAFPDLGVEVIRPPDLPDLHFFVYDRLLTYDHEAGAFSDPELAAAWLQTDTNRGDPAVGPGHEPSVISSVARDEYLRRVRQIKHHIYEGDIYQANFTCRFDCLSPLDPFAAYLRLRRLNPCWYGAYLNFGGYRVLSSSPERMFCLTRDRILSSPIKGTIGLGRSSVETAQNITTLMNSAKDRAELLMIVDLLRNDLGKIAEIGSVRVENLFRPEVHSSLIHLVADIAARPAADIGLADVIKALLPGGSVTGAPKKRAVEILQQLELTPRSVYTGCIGRLGGGEADFNIAIRTMIHDHDGFRIHAGGGIVADSEPESEYEEMLLKARNLFRALEIET